MQVKAARRRSPRNGTLWLRSEASLVGTSLVSLVGARQGRSGTGNHPTWAEGSSAGNPLNPVLGHSPPEPTVVLHYCEQYELRSLIGVQADRNLSQAQFPRHHIPMCLCLLTPGRIHRLLGYSVCERILLVKTQKPVNTHADLGRYPSKNILRYDVSGSRH
ncbi:hypothetical protein N656DRAFT_773490 [Canariomyces notabilis]|uniref:Uncharacterized protein n=1 Tax=Canariomyces notabilis TaxID=2074819 RepID=A0AAN6TMW7_9PEZI|nr:hypothetical protein N656DRAFT_773490 [Canariomyces arenarius]